MSDITGCRKTGVPLYLSIPNIKVCPKKFQFRQVPMYRFYSDKHEMLNSHNSKRDLINKEKNKQDCWNWTSQMRTSILQSLPDRKFKKKH